MKLLGSTKSKVTKDKHCESVSYLEITEVVLRHCNVVNNSYQQNSKALHTFVPNKSFGKLLNILPQNFIFLETFDSEFSYIEVWLTDQNSNLLEIEDKINTLYLLIKHIKKDTLFSSNKISNICKRLRIFVFS